MMKLLKTLWNRIKILFGKAAESIEDTVGEAKLGIEEAKASAASNRQQIAKLMGSNKSLQTDMSEAQNQIETYDTLANKFAVSGDVDNTQAAIKKRDQEKRKYESLKGTVTANNQLIKDLRERLEKYEAQIKEAETDIVGLEAQHMSAKMREEMVNTKLNEDGLGAVNKLKDKVEQKNNYATSLEELSESTDDKLEAAAKALEDEEDPLIKLAMHNSKK